MKTNLYVTPFFKEKGNLVTVLAQMCHYSQDNVSDPQVWDHSPDTLDAYMMNTSYQIACFLAQNTVLGENGVESDVVIRQLVKMPPKTVKAWEKIISKLVKELGGFR